MFWLDGVKFVLIGLMWDFWGIVMVMNSWRMYGLLFDWLYLVYMLLLL